MPARLGFGRRAEPALLALEQDAAGTLLEPAGDDLDQCRFAGAIVAEQRHHLAAIDLEADAAQGFDRAEILGDFLELEQGSPGNHATFLPTARRRNDDGTLVLPKGICQMDFTNEV